MTEKTVLLKFDDTELAMAEYEKPSYDIAADLDGFLEGVKNAAEEEREVKVTAYIKNKMQLILLDWKTRYRQNDEIIANIENKSSFDEQAFKEKVAEEKSLRKKIKGLDASLYKANSEIMDFERMNPEDKGGNKKITLIFFFIIAAALGIVSAYKFAMALSQIEMQLMVQTTVDAVTDNSPGLFKIIIFTLASFSILAGGKIISTIYEKLNYNKMFYLTFAGLAIITIVFSAYFLAQDKAFMNEKAIVDNYSLQAKLQLKDINKQLARPGKRKVMGDAREKLETEKNELNAKIETLTEKSREATNEAIGLDKISVILIVLTEIFVGAVAWMYAIDYERLKNSNTREHSISILKKHMSDYNAEKVQVNENLEQVAEKMLELKQELHRLNLVLSKIKTENEIDELTTLIINDEVNNALGKLWRIVS